MAEETLNGLVQAIIEDGKIDADEIQQLKDNLYTDGTIDRDELDAVFQINDAVSDNAENDPSWPNEFARIVADGVLKDENSPGVIDSEEATYLTEKIMADGGVDTAEKAALQLIRTEATSIVPEFDEAMKGVGC